MGELGRFRDATLVRIRQPDRTGGAVLPVAHEKRRELRLWCEFCRPLPSGPADRQQGGSARVPAQPKPMEAGQHHRLEQCRRCRVEMVRTFELVDVLINVATGAACRHGLEIAAASEISANQSTNIAKP